MKHCVLLFFACFVIFIVYNWNILSYCSAVNCIEHCTACYGLKTLLTLHFNYTCTHTNTHTWIYIYIYIYIYTLRASLIFLLLLLLLHHHNADCYYSFYCHHYIHSTFYSSLNQITVIIILSDLSTSLSSKCTTRTFAPNTTTSTDITTTTTMTTTTKTPTTTAMTISVKQKQTKKINDLRRVWQSDVIHTN